MMHSFVSDDSSQDGATTADHTKELLQWLRDNNYINKIVSAIW